MVTISPWKLEKALKVRTIRQDIETGMTKKAACEKHGMPYPTYRRWEKRFEARGDSGLIDTRQGNPTPRKTTEAVKQYIRRRRKEDPALSGADLARELEQEGIAFLSRQQVCTILRTEGLNNPVGRVWGKKIGPYGKRACWRRGYRSSTTTTGPDEG